MKPGKIRSILQILCMLLIGVTVGGRLVSGVHWFSDILGGVLISIALLFAFSGFLAGVKETDKPSSGPEN